MKIKNLFALSLCCLGLYSCMDYGPMDEEEFEITEARGLFITNEGNFMFGNASLSYYNPFTRRVENEVFVRANGMKLGDVAQSMTIHNGLGWVVVNNSGVIFAIDLKTFKEVGRVEGFTSPRYIHFVSDTKAYVSQLWDNRICVVDPQTYKITGYIKTPMDLGKESTEQMIQYGKYVFVNCWSYNNKILVIDSEADEIVDEIEVGYQPKSMALDAFQKLWVLCDGGFDGSPIGKQVPALYRIDAKSRAIEKEFQFQLEDTPNNLALNGQKDTLYMINRDVWKMGVNDKFFPVQPFIPEKKTIYYGLTVDPLTSEVYIADAIDYVQSGIIMRYSSNGKLVDEFKVGITPGSFCWK